VENINQNNGLILRAKDGAGKHPSVEFNRSAARLQPPRRCLWLVFGGVRRERNMTTSDMFSSSVLGGACVLGVAMTGAPQTMAESVPADMALSEADRQAVFKAAGAVQRKGMWVICTDDPNTSGAVIETVRDLNGDGRPEAVVTEGGTFCYGFTGTAFQLLSKQVNGSWRVMTGSNGIPQFLKTKGAGGWPDISVGGPGFCFPVERWNGKAYAPHRFEYEGKRCKPPR
jgi:hypothetical protein